MADTTLGAYNIFDLRAQALKRVPKGLFEFVDRGTEDEVSLRNNRAAFECGADAVVVSNHGGRNLDGSMAPLEALPDVADAVNGRVVVMVDSGFRRGSDVVKALALGADCVLIGRSTLYGIAAAGHAGATRALQIFREEIDRVMALNGCRSIADIGPELLHIAEGPLARRGGAARPGPRLLDVAKVAGG